MNLEMKYTSVWSFGDETDQISIKYKGRCLPEIPRYCIERYSKPNDLVLDVCCGSGTAWVEAVQLGRRAIGIEPSQNGQERIKERITEVFGNKYFYLTLDQNEIQERENLIKMVKSMNVIVKGDSRKLPLPMLSVDFAFAHIPYWSVITYTTKEEENEMDISRVWSLKKFNEAIFQIYKEVYRVLRNDKYFAVLVGDIRQGGWKVPLGVIQTILLDKIGFEFTDMIIKKTENAISMRRPVTIKKALEENRTVTVHEYIIICQKKRKKREFKV